MTFHGINSSTATATDARMLWASLRRQPGGMSDLELTRLWMPTWSRKQVQGLLNELVHAGLARADGDRARARYVACEPSSTRAAKPQEEA